jgi:alanyl-tRNA synthetase
LPGEVAFRLYDTYGFPLDLTEAIGRDEGFVVDTKGFEGEMKKQRERAREHWKGSGDAEVEEVFKQLRSQDIKTEFTGYKKTRETARVKALIVSGQVVHELEDQGMEFQLITDRTPFYGESGGQVGDRGWIKAKNIKAEVLDTVKPFENFIVHICRLDSGTINVGDMVKLEVDTNLRQDTMRNHSSTHLLQAALQETLGRHVQQKGSLVSPDRLRFDFTHFSPFTEEELAKVERRVNELIRENASVSAKTVPYQEAIDQGAMALFGEKYGDQVRLVRMGEFSRELCGGTHVRRTGDIGFFKILSESSVAAGVRRIEAVTGRAAVEHVQAEDQTLRNAAAMLKASPSELIERIQRLQEEDKRLKRELKTQKQSKGGIDIDQLISCVKEVNGVNVLASEVDMPDPKQLRELSDRLRNKIKSGIVVLGSRSDDKAILLVAITKDLTETYKAGEIISHLAKVIGGRGGGREDLAQAGGPDAEKLKQALEKSYDLIEQTG